MNDVIHRMGEVHGEGHALLFILNATDDTKKNSSSPKQFNPLYNMKYNYNYGSTSTSSSSLRRLFFHQMYPKVPRRV